MVWEWVKVCDGLSEMVRGAGVTEGLRPTGRGREYRALCQRLLQHMGEAALPWKSGESASILGTPHLLPLRSRALSKALNNFLVSQGNKYPYSSLPTGSTWILFRPDIFSSKMS